MDFKKIIILLISLYTSISWSAPLPGNIIINPKATASLSQFDFYYDVTAVQNFSRIYLDIDRVPNSGFPQGGLNAEYMVENDTLYKYVGPGWNWSKVKALTYTDGTSKHWIISRDDIITNNNCAGTVDYLYQVESAAGISTLTKMSLAYPATENCEQNTQKIAIPSYFYPCTGTANCYWDQLNKGAPTAGLALINPYNGPGTKIDPLYLQQVVRTQTAGASVLGYVYTSYGQRSAAAVKADIDKYYQWYPVDGIFFDEGSTDCAKLSYYQGLNNYVKTKAGKGLTSVNFGTNTPECFINATDILVTFESAYSAYVNWKPDSWTTKYAASRFWHLVYDTQQTNLNNAIALSKKRNAGWVYVTPDVLPNPWNSLPDSCYWSNELSAVNVN